MTTQAAPIDTDRSGVDATPGAPRAADSTTTQAVTTFPATRAPLLGRIAALAYGSIAYVGFLMACCCTPRMTWGHLLFGAGSRSTAVDERGRVAHADLRGSLARCRRTTPHRESRRA